MAALSHWIGLLPPNSWDLLMSNPIASTVKIQEANSRSIVISAFAAVLSDVNRLASDLLFFTTKECDFFTLAPSFYSGSSIMPQKNNLDVAELLRGKAKKVLGHYIHIATLPLDLISGYNRHLQDLKRPLIDDSVETTTEALEIAELVVSNLTPIEDHLRKACSPEISIRHIVFSMRLQTARPFATHTAPSPRASIKSR